MKEICDTSGGKRLEKEEEDKNKACKVIRELEEMRSVEEFQKQL